MRHCCRAKSATRGPCGMVQHTHKAAKGCAPATISMDAAACSSSEHVSDAAGATKVREWGTGTSEATRRGPEKTRVLKGSEVGPRASTETCALQSSGQTREGDRLQDEQKAKRASRKHRVRTARAPANTLRKRFEANLLRDWRMVHRGRLHKALRDRHHQQIMEANDHGKRTLNAVMRGRNHNQTARQLQTRPGSEARQLGEGPQQRSASAFPPGPTRANTGTRVAAAARSGSAQRRSGRRAAQSAGAAAAPWSCGPNGEETSKHVISRPISFKAKRRATGST